MVSIAARHVLALALLLPFCAGPATAALPCSAVFAVHSDVLSTWRLMPAATRRSVVETLPRAIAVVRAAVDDGNGADFAAALTGLQQRLKAAALTTDMAAEDAKALGEASEALGDALESSALVCPSLHE